MLDRHPAAFVDCAECRELKPDFRDGVEHIYDIKLSVALGLMFDEPPTERELRQAMFENFMDKVTSRFFDVDLDDDIEYELLDVDTSGVAPEDNA